MILQKRDLVEGLEKMAMVFRLVAHEPVQLVFVGQESVHGHRFESRLYRVGQLPCEFIADESASGNVVVANVGEIGGDGLALGAKAAHHPPEEGR